MIVALIILNSDIRKANMKKLLGVVLISLFSIGTAVAHSGGTDSYGCHNDHKKGGYHCH